jgi:hypothetical protein
LLLLFLIGSGVLLVVWYTDESRQLDVQSNFTRFIVSLGAIIVLMTTLVVFLFNLLRGDKRRSKKHRVAAKPIKSKPGKHPASKKRVKK